MSRHVFIYTDDAINHKRIHTEYEADEKLKPRVLYEFAKHLGHAYGYNIVDRVQVNMKTS